MPQQLLSYPFRIDYNNSRFGIVSDDTSTYRAEQIHAFLKTNQGERPLMPSFGIEDPVFNDFDADEFLDTFLDFYNSEVIKINNIYINKSQGVTSSVIVEFD